MPRNITAAQKCARDFYKSDALAQTNPINYECFSLHNTETTKILLSQDLNVEKKFRARFCRFYIVL